jgi:hypothetical protein
LPGVDEAVHQSADSTAHQRREARRMRAIAIGGQPTGEGVDPVAAGDELKDPGGGDAPRPKVTAGFK